MAGIFADTVFLFGKVNPQDTHHRNALAAEAALGDRELVTTNAVFAELLALASKRGPEVRRGAAQLIHEMFANRNVTVVRVNPAIFARGFARYESMPDSTASLVDCISMEVMDDLGITEVLTADRDFELEGFSRLMRNPREAHGE